MDPETLPKKLETDPVSHLAHQLGERVKELNCLFGISDIVEQAGGSLERIFQETVELLPQSWNHVDVACARIVLGEVEYRSKSYAEPVATLRTDIVVHGEVEGVLEVSYWEQRASQAEGPFGKEERKLLNAVAERMGHIVERLTAEERLREKEEEFREKMTHFTRVSTMGEMASNIAHEVNQPLTAIATYAQACRRLVDGGSVEAPEVLEVLERIGEEALRAGDIIQRLRGLVRRRDNEMIECDITQLLNEIAPLASVDARLNNVDLSFVLPEDAPQVLADGVQIQQVVLNLIRNGIDAMVDTAPEERSLEVRVRSVAVEEVQVSVTDQGCGIAETSDKILFQPFFTTKKAGLGLGLNISRSIITAHGGRLWFSRNPDGGTTFHFTLPAASEANDD
jgi:C4-dicarboxylate-specific signal transduction histidine kinase